MTTIAKHNFNGRHFTNLVKASYLAIAAVAITAVAGCASSPPVHYHTLVASQQAVGAAAAPAPFDFALLPINVPPQVDRSSLVLRLGRDQVAVLEDEHWVAPLKDEVRSALSADLTRRLGAIDVTAVARNPVRPVVQISFDVQRFELLASGSTTLDVVWSARNTDAAHGDALICKASWNKPTAGSSYPVLVAAQQGAIDAIAAQISETLITWNAKGRAACPGGL